MSLISPGDSVVCVMPPALSKGGLPKVRPELGKTYVVTGVYDTPYGQGCTLEGLDAFPYDGYVLFAADGNTLHVASGYYFNRLTSFGQSL